MGCCIRPWPVHGNNFPMPGGGVEDEHGGRLEFVKSFFTIF